MCDCTCKNLIYLSKLNFDLMCNWTCHIFNVFLLMLNSISRGLSSYVGFQDFHLCFSVGIFGRLCLALHCKLYPYI